MTLSVDAATWDVLAAARDLATRYKITPNWQERLTPEARRFIEAVEALDRAESAR